MKQFLDFLLFLLATLKGGPAPIGAGERSPGWQAERNKHIKGNGSCRACGATTKLEVHHILPFHLYPALEMVEENWITLCKDCHYLFGHLKDWKSWNATVVEDSRVYLNKRKNRPTGVTNG